MSEHSSILESMKKRIGFDDWGRSDAETYERGKKIVPDCIGTNDDETPIRQYDIAILETNLKNMRAEGRLQVTNQRIIFRAAGRSMAGKTLVQHSFSLQEVGGVEVRRDARFGVGNLIMGAVAALIVAGIFGIISQQIYASNAVGGFVFALVIGIAGLVPFFMIKKQFFIKVLCCSAGLGSLLGASLSSSLSSFLGMGSFGDMWGLDSSWYSGANSGVNVAQFSPILLIIAAIAGILAIIALILSSIRPNFVFVIKTKSAAGIVEIRRKNKNEEYTGYEEVLPGIDADKAVKEINAMINDVTVRGVHALKSWAE